MNEESSNPNIEWKKAGFDFNEKITLKINVRQAISHKAHDKNQGRKSNHPTLLNDLPNGLKKIRKKIKSSYEEDDDDEDSYQITSFTPPDYDNSLLNALQEDEKKFLKQEQDIQTINTLQDTERNQKIANADKIASTTGLAKGLNKDILARSVGENYIGKDITQEILTRQVAKKFHIREEKISDENIKKFMTGIKRIQNEGGNQSLIGMKVRDILNAGENKKDNPKEIRKMLQKSGRLKKNNHPKRKLPFQRDKSMELIKKLNQASQQL